MVSALAGVRTRPELAPRRAELSPASRLALAFAGSTLELARRPGDTGGVRRAVSTHGDMTVAGLEQLELTGLRLALTAADPVVVVAGRGEKS